MNLIERIKRIATGKAAAKLPATKRERAVLARGTSFATIKHEPVVRRERKEE
jgi:3-phenylpropionate/cinnamic acid dioxygenase small subunit